MPEIKIFLQFTLVFIMVVSVIGIFINRHIQNRGIGARIIQFSGVLLVVPLIGILALEGIIEPQTTGTIIGALLGYLLSGISNFDKNESSGSSSSNTQDPVEGNH